ncbi:hypothetical protein NPIL_696681 [Nephila pilipes]|uniref:Uncharacterized protein n=1 Tax=Nephila pilipes TaxID=299642 RepID=A0A8X6TCF0_NEPPI|nr:hypothetical protein NPIL_696681 [Nephila pilipes]
MLNREERKRDETVPNEGKEKDRIKEISQNGYWKTSNDVADDPLEHTPGGFVREEHRVSKGEYKNCARTTTLAVEDGLVLTTDRSQDIQETYTSLSNFHHLTREYLEILFELVFCYPLYSVPNAFNWWYTYPKGT